MREGEWPSDTAMTVLRTELRLTYVEIAALVDKAMGWLPTRAEVKGHLDNLNIR